MYGGFGHGYSAFLQKNLFCFLLISFSGVYLQQNNHIKASEERYRARTRLLETLATGASEETQVFECNFNHIHIL